MPKYGPPAGSSSGIQFATTVRLCGASGAVNAYTSVLSALGSSMILGASRWDDPKTPGTASEPAASAAAAAAPRTVDLRMSAPSVGDATDAPPEPRRF